MLVNLSFSINASKPAGVEYLFPIQTLSLSVVIDLNRLFEARWSERRILILIGSRVSDVLAMHVSAIIAWAVKSECIGKLFECKLTEHVRWGIEVCPVPVGSHWYPIWLYERLLNLEGDKRDHVRGVISLFSFTITIKWAMDYFSCPKPLLGHGGQLCMQVPNWASFPNGWRKLQQLSDVAVSAGSHTPVCAIFITLWVTLSWWKISSSASNHCNTCGLSPRLHEALRKGRNSKQSSIGYLDYRHFITHWFRAMKATVSILCFQESWHIRISRTRFFTYAICFNCKIDAVPSLRRCALSTWNRACSINMINWVLKVCEILHLK